MLKYLLLWFPMVVIAVLNGALRQAWYAHFLPELRAHQLSTLIGVLLFAVYIGWALKRWPVESAGRAVQIGILWVVLTVAFEFGMGLAGGRSWAYMLADYNLAAGRVWVLVLAWLAVAPGVLYMMRR